MSNPVPARWARTYGILVRRSSHQAICVAAVAGIGLLIFYLNRNPVAEQDVYLGDYLPYARYLTGDGPREVVTYPMWGYPAVIAISGDFFRMAVQYALALGVILAVLNRLGRERPVGLVGTLIIAVASVPWFATASLNSASAIAVPLIWLAVLTVLCRAGVLNYRRALVAGALIGIALNFRSEFLILPGVLALAVVALSAMRAHRLIPRRTSVGPAIALLFVAWASLLPWAIFSQVKTGEINVTSTNGGAVSFITLGQLPGNPWGIVHEDAQARRALDERGHEDVHPYSAEGNDILRSLFLDSIRSEPAACARKVVRNIRNAMIGGLYFGDWEPWLPGSDEVRIDVVKEKIKERLGVNPNLSQIEIYQESGIWDDNLGAAEVILVGVAVLFVIGTDLLIVLALITAVVLLASRRLDTLHVFSLLIMAYVVILVGLLQYQPRHMNTAWPALIIFGDTALAGAVIWARRRLPGLTIPTRN